MDKIVYRLVFNRKKKLNSKGMALVQIEAYLRGKRKYFSTHVYLRPSQWDARRQLVQKHPNSTALNRQFRTYLAMMESKELEMYHRTEYISLEMLQESIQKNESAESFIAFLQREMACTMLKESTRYNHLTTLRHLRAFRRDISFGEVTFALIVDFENFLRSKDMHINTVAKHMRHLKRYINIAIGKGFINANRYAFGGYKIKTVENRHTFLLPDELHQLEQWSETPAAGKYRHTVEAFLFCCYTGLRYSDFTNLNAENIVRVKQHVWLVFRSIKTNILIRIPLYLLFHGRGLKILKKYEGRENELFRLKNNSNINKELLRIARMAGIRKHISFHTARHTNATLLIYSGANITTVQKLLGHKSVKTTQVYAHVIDRTLIHDLKKL